MERTLVLIKPDAFQRLLVGKIITRLEMKGLKLVAAKMVQISESQLNTHYSHLVEQDFFPEIKKFMSTGPVLASCWEGLDAVDTVRKLCGITKAREAEPGTIRGDFAMSVQCNLIHASENNSAATQELSNFFSEHEYFDYNYNNLSVLYSEHEQS